MHELRAQAAARVADADADAVPVGAQALNVHGRYSFTAQGVPDSGVRALRDPLTPIEDEE